MIYNPLSTAQLHFKAVGFAVGSEQIYISVSVYDNVHIILDLQPFLEYFVMVGGSRSLALLIHVGSGCLPSPDGVQMGFL